MDHHILTPVLWIPVDAGQWSTAALWIITYLNPGCGSLWMRDDGAQHHCGSPYTHTRAVDPCGFQTVEHRSPVDRHILTPRLCSPVEHSSPVDRQSRQTCLSQQPQASCPQTVTKAGGSLGKDMRDKHLTKPRMWVSSMLALHPASRMPLPSASLPG